MIKKIKKKWGNSKSYNYVFVSRLKFFEKYIMYELLIYRSLSNGLSIKEKFIFIFWGCRGVVGREDGDKKNSSFNFVLCYLRNVFI